MYSIPRYNYVLYERYQIRIIIKPRFFQEQLEIINIIGAGNKEPANYVPFCMSIDDIDSHKLSRVLGYLDTHKNEDSPTKSEEPSKPPETNLRRSNSDGNLPKTVNDAQKEHRVG